MNLKTDFFICDYLGSNHLDNSFRMNSEIKFTDHYLVPSFIFKIQFLKCGHPLFFLVLGVPCFPRFHLLFLSSVTDSGILPLEVTVGGPES